MFKFDDGRPMIVAPGERVTVKTLCASYHKIQRLTGTFVKDGPTGLRLFTEKECKAIMGFPMNFKVPVSRTQMYRQFGNSVAVPVVEKVANTMIKKYKILTA
ncbi:MAG: DNA-cytosine methyltransferase [Candidatus Woesebacteria bacterium GW2011_GWC1_43_10b]|uniref:DNA (cytosine-5-)-methyltransferase n=1 Tax=Candidatus Woesebacteria bacterium GW2011_GWC1_43_10b TaxID=1618585 RepID=A0A0G1F1Z9_9BACT|nr:MAG: DNA-cytosine methyltransferase [Candidatus Woesebacteria bacterium GW2011_GWC1_43_10b]